jgi:hypothetical protein
MELYFCRIAVKSSLSVAINVWPFLSTIMISPSFVSVDDVLIQRYRFTAWPRDGTDERDDEPGAVVCVVGVEG